MAALVTVRTVRAGARALRGGLVERLAAAGVCVAGAVRSCWALHGRAKLVQAARHPPWTAEARNMAERFWRHADAYFRVITTPGVEPTNNLAQQALRFVVIDRRITQGTRGAAGRARCERIWTAAAHLPPAGPICLWLPSQRSQRPFQRPAHPLPPTGLTQDP